MAYPPYYNYVPQQIYAQQGPMMAQAGTSGGYMPIYAPPAAAYAQHAQHAQTPFIPPGAMTETPPVGPSQPLQAKSRPKHSNRAASTPLPLKSALKKTPAPGAAPLPAQAPVYSEAVPPRRRTNSRVKADKYAGIVPQNQMVRQPSDKQVQEAYHMFVTFKGDSELLLENTLEFARQEIEKEIFPLWPHGVESSQFRDSNWKIRFRNSPWNMNGPDVATAWKLIAALFTLFSVRGFSFITSTKCTTQQPRLIFQITNSDRTSIFFLAYFSRGGRRVSLINPPHHIATAFGPTLKVYLPNQVEVIHETGMVTVETKREMAGTGGMSVTWLPGLRLKRRKLQLSLPTF
ncbi:hypothetical protein B0H17DRAFT_1293261 [Mycena rosella]|uniref:Uncharacterized protein n=1 Tax=Mycena rosella TaxID=1033263 RepID=A0AAD7GVF9_MYCRO|nr:hypothetical protein B0H17DRAFT_1293261 [Mycena rosella]